MSMKKLLDEMVTPISNEYGKFDSYFTESMLTCLLYTSDAADE